MASPSGKIDYNGVNTAIASSELLVPDKESILNNHQKKETWAKRAGCKGMYQEEKDQIHNRETSDVLQFDEKNWKSHQC